MRSINIKKIIGITALSMFAVFGTATIATAQGSYRTNQRQSREIQKKREKAIREQAKRQEQYRRQQERQIRINRNYNNGVVFTAGDRYRVYRNGRYYNTDGRGAELLRQAVNQGYQQGYEAGRIDRANRRGSQWNRNDVYRSGTFGYQSYVDRGQYQYYFQQGFQKGYQDGYYSRNRYGTYNNGSASILGSILGSILNLRSY
ncbi:MAG: hypothetical protein ABJA02_13120 [Acidobacteriota bacterium]